MTSDDKKVRKIYFLQKRRTPWLIRLMEFLEKEEIDMHVECTHFVSMQEMFEMWKIEEPFVIVFGTEISTQIKLDFLKKYRLFEEKLPVEVICLYQDEKEEIELRLGSETLDYKKRLTHWDQGKPKSWELINSSLFTENFDVQVISILKTLWKTLYNRVDDTRLNHTKNALAAAMQKIEQLQKEGIEHWPEPVIQSFNDLKKSLSESFSNQNSQRYQVFLYEGDFELTPTQELILEAWSYSRDVKSIQTFLEKYGKTLTEETIQKHLKTLDEEFQGSAILKMQEVKKIKNRRTAVRNPEKP